MAGTIQVERVDRWDRYTFYDVFVDDEKVGEIARGQTVSYEVSPGKHRVRLGGKWAQSPEQAVEVSQVVRYAASGPAWYLWNILHTFRSKRYFRLEPESAPAPAT